MRVGLIGAGAIATYLMEEAEHHTYKVESILVRDKQKYAYLEEKFGVKLYEDVDSFIASSIDIVVEAATVEAVQTFLPQIIAEKDAVIISIGAFVDDAFLQN